MFILLALDGADYQLTVVHGVHAVVPGAAAEKPTHWGQPRLGGSPAKPWPGQSAYSIVRGSQQGYLTILEHSKF